MTDISVPLGDELEAIVNGDARAAALSLLTGLVKTTPVDTGRAKGNWFVSTGAPNRSVDKERRAGQANSQGQQVILSAEKEDFPTITISNNLPYIQRLNDGHSTQAPKKFVESEIIRVTKASNLNAG